MGGKIYIDVHSKLTHQGMKTYEGDLANSIKTNLPNAIPGQLGAKINLFGMENL
ncbi:MAG: hypothetical protein KA014_01550 [Acinetobacter sp.]|nr:hypothetical protein [Acinetobacter sp.]